jgi:DNA-binding GntR family transcriptional regulator
MAKPRTANLPDLSGLREPADEFMRDVQRVLLRRGDHDLPSLSIAEQIAARLAGMIALDRLKPGQRILEEEICAVLGVSRAPVREALRMLERDRLLVVVPRRGAQVSGYNDKELHDIFEVRASLIATMYEAIARAHPEEFERALSAGVAELEAARKAGSADRYALASFRLTIGIRALCDNLLLSDMVQSLALQTLRYSRLGFGIPQGIERSLRDWHAVVRAVRRREPELAGALVRRRIAGSRDAALRALRAEQIELSNKEEASNGSAIDLAGHAGRPLRRARVASPTRAATGRRGGASRAA